MPPTPQVRQARPEDSEEIFAMIRELAEYENLTHQITGTERELKEQLFGPRPLIEALIATLEDEVCGFALFFSNFSTFLTRPGLYLEDLYVRPAMRGVGAGKALLTRLAALAVERGAGRFEWSVLDWNEPAIRFYRSMGAEILSEWRICRVSGAALQSLAERGRSGA